MSHLIRMHRATADFVLHFVTQFLESCQHGSDPTKGTGARVSGPPSAAQGTTDRKKRWLKLVAEIITNAVLGSVSSPVSSRRSTTCPAGFRTSPGSTRC